MHKILKTNITYAMEKILKRCKKDNREILHRVNVMDGIAYVSDGKICLFAPVKKLIACVEIADGSYNMEKAEGGYILEKVETSATPPNYKQIAVKGNLIYEHNRVRPIYAESVFGIMSMFDACNGKYFASYGCDLIEIARPLIEGDNFKAYRLGGGCLHDIARGCYIEGYDNVGITAWSLLVMPISIKREDYKLECTPPDAIEAKPEPVAAKIEAKAVPVVIEKPKAAARSPFAL